MQRDSHELEKSANASIETRTADIDETMSHGETTCLAYGTITVFFRVLAQHCQTAINTLTTPEI